MTPPLICFRCARPTALCTCWGAVANIPPNPKESPWVCHAEA